MPRPPARQENLRKEAASLASMIQRIEAQTHLDRAWREAIISDLKSAILRIYSSKSPVSP